MSGFLEPGVWGVVATPFDETLSLDRRSLARLVGHYAGIGVQGLTVLGVFGEAAALSRAERASVLRTVIDAVDLPLVVGLTSLATAPATEEALAVVDVAGDRAAALMVQVNSADSAVATDHLDRIAAQTGRPIVVQDYPVASGVAIPIAALRRVVGSLAPTGALAAVKAEAPPTPPAIAALSDSGVPVFGGLGGVGLLDELSCGSAGAMTGFSFPEALQDCVSAFRAGGYPKAREVYTPYLPLVTFEQQARIGLAIRKECLVARGLIDHGAVRPPAAGLPDVLRPLLRDHVDAVSTYRRR